MRLLQPCSAGQIAWAIFLVKNLLNFTWKLYIVNYCHIFIAHFKRGKSLFKLNTFILWGGRRELPATHLPAKFVLGPEKWSPILVCACRTYLAATTMDN